jgi:RHS repeat-associated protein
VLAIHTDQVLRPVLMTDATAAVAWRARFRPFGELISVTGPKSLDARFPGQWFQFEAGLHANWHRNYDPTLGRYLEADPLGFPDGPNRYAYVGSSPLMYVDPEGKHAILVRILAGAVAAAAANLASQLFMNGGDISCVSWEDVIISGIPGRSRKGGSQGADSPPAIASPTPPKYGVNDPPVRIPGKWSDQDLLDGLQGKPPRGLGKPDLYHADQMPGSGIHEILPGDHRNNKSLHPNKYEQGVTDKMRREDRRLHWWYRAQEEGAWSKFPDKIYGPDK